MRSLRLHKNQLVYIVLFTHPDNKHNSDLIKKKFDDFDNIIYTDRLGNPKVLNMRVRDLLIKYIVDNNITPKKTSNPWKIIKTYDPLFFYEIDGAKASAIPLEEEHKGKGIKFLPSDPKVLMNKLKILLAERDAGNNYVFDEISAIADELRRTSVLSLKQIKNLYKNLQ